MSGTSDSPLAVITGVRGGIGRATAERFMAAGWVVAGVGLADVPPPGVTHYRSLDLGAADAQSSLGDFLAKLPRIDALINNAGLQIVKPLLEMTVEEWHRTFAVNLRSAFLAMQLAHPQLKRGGGAVVNVASVHAVATSPGLAAYAASKGGMVAMTRAAALEFAPDGIRVNAVLPGAIETPMLRAGAERLGADGMRQIEQRVPLRRIGQAEEVANAILFLASPESAYVTGATLAVDGGVLAALSSE
ncbi:MAG: SDR family oxidoreductase [Chloroflexota bacterium]|nr:SDR family oxidoreductase [Chloroflexota bacterium]